MINSSSIECKELGPTIPNINPGGTSSVNPSQKNHTYHSQSEIHIKDLPYTYLNGNNEHWSPVTSYTPSTSNPHLGCGFLFPPQTDHSDVSSIDSQAGTPADPLGRNSNIQTFKIQEPRDLPSMKPIGYSITSFINTLPQKISKAAVRTPPYSSFEKTPISPTSEPPAHQFLPDFSYSSFDQSPDQNSLPEDKEYRTSGPTTFENFPSLDFVRPSINYSISTELKQYCAELEPYLKKIASSRYFDAIFNIVRQFGHHVSLGELYNLLYNTRQFVEAMVNSELSTSPKLNSVKILHLVLVTLRCPQFTLDILPYKSIKKLRVSAAKHQEILRTFLAIKILLVAVQRVEFPFMDLYSVKRATVYNFYYLLCQQLIQKYPRNSRIDGLPKNIILGQVIIGKLINLIYPNLPLKRLGQRGKSKAHYIGLTLNYSMLDSETRHLLDFDLSHLKDYFSSETMKSTDMDQYMQPPPCEKEGDIPYSISPSFSPDLATSQTPYPSYIFASGRGSDPSRTSKQEPRTVREKSMGPRFIWKEP
ncbi:hypothetical protein JCM33374_g1301 [Metschnikowia sp. JCM 33374]|nr:hypothetical protein JCM33374_g1301 [Metschnikowia sp. JCM 33374]